MLSEDLTNAIWQDALKASQVYEETLSVEILREIARAYITSTKMTFWSDPKKHVCFQQGCSYKEIKCDVMQDRNDLCRYHVCLGTQCSSYPECTKEFEKFVCTTEHLYVCKLSGVIHVCGKHCDLKETRIAADSIGVCVVSGLVAENPECRSMFWQPTGEKDLTREFRYMRKTNFFLIEYAQLHASDMYEGNEEINNWIRRDFPDMMGKDKADGRQVEFKHLLLAIQCISLRFHVTSLFPTIAERKGKMKSLQMDIDTYSNKCIASALAPTPEHVNTLISGKVEPYYALIPHLHMAKRLKNDTIVRFAMEACYMWYSVHRHAKMKLKAGKLLFRNFVHAYLDHRKNGMFVNVHDKNETIIPPDFLLIAVPSSSSATFAPKNAKKEKRKDTIAAHITAIYSCIYDALKLGVTPEFFRPSPEKYAKIVWSEIPALPKKIPTKKAGNIIRENTNSADPAIVRKYMALSKIEYPEGSRNSAAERVDHPRTELVRAPSCYYGKRKRM
jgi:hypothetical protein